MSRIVVAMSGGVDSTLAAALLHEQGHETIGVTLRLHPCEGSGQARSCCGGDSVAQARAVAGQLGIPHHVLDCQDLFADEVLRPAWDDYRNGRTPNPCVLCNARLKFGALLEFARTLGAERVATGHYARLLPGADPAAAPVLHRGADRAKDQSYFLFALDPGQRRAACFPLGGLEKCEVRRLARERGLVTADRAESQDICLAGDAEGFASLLAAQFAGGATRPGHFVDETGRVLGAHRGVESFTIGQRRGLGVALGAPAWVSEIRAGTAEVVLTTREEALLAGGLEADGMVWQAVPPEAGAAVPCEVQTRYRQRPTPASVVRRADGSACVHFLRPVKAVTPGQAAVLYQGDRVLGGGWIRRSLPLPS